MREIKMGDLTWTPSIPLSFTDPITGEIICRHIVHERCLYYEGQFWHLCLSCSMISSDGETEWRKK